MITEKYAKLLQLKKDLPALVMDRVIYQQNNKPAFYSHALIRGDRCRYYYQCDPIGYAGRKAEIFIQIFKRIYV